ncbi:MAG: HAD-IA family hydrolase [Verrucomicrobiota bacterium]
MGANPAIWNSNPRAVLLDVGFTLTFLDGERIARLAAAVGLSVLPAAIEAAESTLRRETAAGNGPPSVALATAANALRREAPAFYRRLLQLAMAPGDGGADRLDAAANALWTAHLKDNLWCRVGPGVNAALARLRNAGILLAVVSNSEGTVAAMLEAVGLARHLEIVIDSWVVGVEKPDPRIFRFALDHLSVAAHDAVMVGDTPAADVAGAEAAGICAVLLDPLGVYPAVNVPRFTDVAAFADALLRDRARRAP